MNVQVPFELLKAFLPIKWLACFELKEFSERNKEWQIVLVEKEDCIPKELQDKEAVQNGFLNPVEISDFPLRGKSTYLKFIRRRWKEAGQNKSYFNQYDFHPKGMKATKEFGSFLKGFDRREADLLCGDR